MPVELFKQDVYSMRLFFLRCVSPGLKLLLKLFFDCLLVIDVACTMA
jgi:hypothetical protein